MYLLNKLTHFINFFYIIIYYFETCMFLKISSCIFKSVGFTLFDPLILEHKGYLVLYYLLVFTIKMVIFIHSPI